MAWSLLFQIWNDTDLLLTKKGLYLNGYRPFFFIKKIIEYWILN